MTTTNAVRAAATSADPRWASVTARDARADGSFVYSVATTGVYCRPSCGARRARPENVAFHSTPADARRAGFRACKRCDPDGSPPAQRSAALVAELCRFIEEEETPPSLEALAARAGLSPHHLHRLFKAATGLTPRAYAAGRRAERVRGELEGGATVTEAIHGAGYGSSSRFYEESDRVLGMTPRQYRAGGGGARIRFAVGNCSLGSVLVARSERGVCAIFLGDDPEELERDLRRRFRGAEIEAADAGFDELVARVVALVESPGGGLDLPLDVRGTAFQRRVWRALCDIPAGATASYAEVAARIGSPKSVRAVAGACGANPLSVVIPCHRVLHRDGTISGYRWGVERKRALLAREAEAAGGGPARGRRARGGRRDA